MKYLFIFFSFIGCFSCDLRNPQQVQIEKIESLLTTYPDSVYLLLDSLVNENDLDEACFAKSCLLISKAADKINGKLLSIADYEKSIAWYNSNGEEADRAQILFYLGRSYTEKMQYEKAMNAYLYALGLFEKIQDFNKAGYVASYMADLFEAQNDPVGARRNYMLAADYFHKSGNERSYVLALNDIARELAFQDSCESALKYLEYADSLAFILQDSIVKITVYNSLGNVYKIMGKFSQSEKYLLGAASIDTTTWGIPNLLALSDLYLEAGDLNKASDFQNQMMCKIGNNKQYIDMIMYNQYKIYKAQESYKDALLYLEKYQDVFDSNAQISDNVNLLEMEKKYNKLKVQQENQRLKLSQQLHIILLIVSILILLVVSLIYLIFQKKAYNKIHSQEREINQFNIDVLNLTLELEQKKRMLNSMRKEYLKKADLENDISTLSKELDRIKRKQLLESTIGKKLKVLSQKHMPGNTKTMITEKMFENIEIEVKRVYPEFKSQILELCPNISDSDWMYCCFLLFNFDVKAEAVLLCLTPGSVRTRHLRLRQRLNIQLGNGTLYDYFVNFVINS
ncbi:hypothetical protein M1P97_12620 [Parabacteroides sp. GYB001]|uniref:hypothetical protein n=1 Tax=Parabacteroides leei TaxID=2939491 RepID=UPI002016AA4F|nr:hypothetical protein [Parabacteroides leei]MCL3852132.1 hypothetical protein [Parabacteroides leei]